ncbi:MAG TPA: tetratricopeptide repeat protein [Pirellulales bacterium]|nr:tetratricopeptide repeat protein [Pirellulales bacterium]
MRVRIGVVLILGVVASLVHASVSAAEGEGQADLDKAIETKLASQTIVELGAVIDLCQSALDKGLDKGNEAFCNELLSATLLQRAEAICDRLFDQGNDLGDQWPVFWRLALKDVERAIKIDAKQPLAQLLLGKLQSIPGADGKKARQALDEAIQLAKDDDQLKSQALRWRAMTSDNLDARLKDLTEAIELAPGDAKMLRDRGVAYLVGNRADDALADFDAALTVESHDAATHNYRGLALDVLQRYEEARQSFAKAAELEPMATEPLLQRARVSFNLRKFDDSIEDAKRVLELEPDNVDGLIIKAQALALDDKADEAVSDANRAVEMKPESDDVLRIWAMVTEKAGKTADAIDSLRKQVEANPDDAVAWLQLGLLYAAEKEMPKAIDAFSAAIKIDRDREFAYEMRANSYLNRGMRKNAIADYQKALKLDQDNSGVLNNLAWLLATAPEDELRDGEAALTLATQASEITNYKQAHILSTLASAYAEMGDFEKAREWSQKSIDIADDSLKGQLRKELASYEKKQPWRERQEESDVKSDE